MFDPPSSGWQLTLDAVAHYPRPGTNVPGQLAFSPDGRLLTYLFSERGDLIRDLWAIDVRSGERSVLVRAPEPGASGENVPAEEALRRERQRIREGGITHYSWARAADRVLVPIHGQLYVTSSQGGLLRPIAPDGDAAADARLTPDGCRVVFVRRREIWVAEVDGGAVRQLTFDADDAVSNGLAEYVAQEEMGRSEGFWVSPGGSSVAFVQLDEGPIRLFPIVHQGGAEGRVEYHRYPFTGGENARVRLGVVPIDGGAVRWLDLGAAADIYVARVDWRPDGRLAVQIQSRDQRRLDLWCYDVPTGERALLLQEESELWVNLHKDLRFVGDDGTFLWSSERTGFRHLSLHAPDGCLIRALTEGEWPVDSVVHLDEMQRRVYFLAGRETPLERHLYRVSLDGGEVIRVTGNPGFHGAVFAPNGTCYAQVFESRTSPPSVTVRSMDGRPPLIAHAGADLEECAPGLRPPDLVQLAAADGTVLYGAIYRPGGAKPDPPSPGPAIVSVYGGPHGQTVADTWAMTVDLRAQYLASRGFLVFKLDNRGSARRGLAFEGAIHRRMGTIEVQDQADGVRWLVGEGLAESERVGVYGWSYGGYMALMCLLTAPDVFKVGVAGAPVTDWDGYDTHYTERYMETPTANPDGYRMASTLAHAAALRGMLLLVHGMLDENVHFRHTARLINALEAADRPYDLVVFPDERHTPRGWAARRYLERRVVEFFATHL